MLQNLIIGIKSIYSNSGSLERNGNFSQCAFHFDETSSNVHSFIHTITVYKYCIHISDVGALKGLLLLLKNYILKGNI